MKELKLDLRIQNLIPSIHSGVRQVQEISQIRKVVPTKQLDIRPGVFKGKLIGFVAEFVIDDFYYEVHTTSISSKTYIDVYLSVDIDGNAVVYTV